MEVDREKDQIFKSIARIESNFGNYGCAHDIFGLNDDSTTSDSKV